jgi:SNF2 family DNA or RNA helicase
LKAGGLGLNLHAAEYVYLLDPWWNPAVEAQAIDRAHRIGQTRKVFAYRLIARDTVEEKVLELQKSKRDLADAIITADNSVMRNLTRDELELLLSEEGIGRKERKRRNRIISRQGAKTLSDRPPACHPERMREI